MTVSSGFAGIANGQAENFMSNKKPITWLQTDRKIDAALIEDMGVKEIDHPKLGQSIAFAYRRKGENYAAKFRTIDKKFLSSQGVTRSLYNADALYRNDDLPVVITEGEIDCLSVIQSGFLKCVSLPDGWTKAGNKTESLIEHEDAIRKAPYVIVAGDNDEAGESLPRVCANLFKGRDVRFCVWPDGCKDPNDVLVGLGEGALSEAINAAKRIDPPGGLITGFSDLPPLSNRRILRTGLDFLDRAVAFEVGAMSVGTGTPGSGKTTFATFAGDKVALNENIRIGFFSFETHPYATRTHLSLIRTGHKFKDLYHDAQAELVHELDKSWRMVHRVEDDDERFHLGWLIGMIETLALRDGCKMIIIDPWNELEHLPEPGESLTNYINFALQQIRQTAARLEVHIMVIAHPKKMMNDAVPGGYDIADSAAFANKPALGFSIHNDQKQGQLFINTWKVRDTLEYGFEKGMNPINYDSMKMTYFGS